MARLKRIATALLSVLLVFCLSACAPNEEADKPETPESSNTVTDSAPSATVESAPSDVSEPDVENVKIEIIIGSAVLEATLTHNSSASAFAELLRQGDITVDMQDYGNFEKVGPLPQNLETNDEQITTQFGDIILYQGNRITIYYDTNSWNFTRLGKIDGVTQDELKSLLGEGDVTVTFRLQVDN